MSSSIMPPNGLYDWLFQTQMSFYEQNLELPWWFGACCWGYSVAGITMLWTQPHWTSKSRFPYQSFAFFLILLQSPLSFAADYLSMDKDSYWHVADRLVACPALVLEISKFLLVCIRKCNHTSTCVVYGLSLLMAVICFLQSQQAQERLDRDAFVFWHNSWHLYPLFGSVIMLVDFYLLDGWKRSARQKYYSIEFHKLKRVD